MSEFRDLTPLLEPRSVAIVGASPKAGWPARIWGMLKHFEYPGEIYLVNPRYEELWGRPCYPSLDALPCSVDNAVFIVPAATVVEMLEKSREGAFRSATILSGGFGEGGDAEGLKRKAFLQGYARERGIAVCGPNCMGHAALRSRAMLFPEQRLNEIRYGGLAMVSQSGGLLGALVRAGASRGIGVSYFVTSGNEAVAELSDYIHHFIRDPDTRVIAAFIEGVKDGEKFLRVAGEALDAGKPIIALKIGRSEKAAAAALAHTGSLAGNDRVFDAVCARAGILRVNDLDEFLNAAELFLRVKCLPSGRRAAFVTFSGGLRGLLSDLAEEHGVELPTLRDLTEKKLSGLLGVGASVGNPLDAGWGGLSSQETHLKCIDTLLSDRDVDMLFLQEEVPLSGARPDKESNLAAVAKVAEASDKPICMFSMITQSLNDYAREFKQRCALPFLQGADNAIKMQKHLARFGEAVQRRAEERYAKAAAPQPLTDRAVGLLASRRVLNEWEAYSILAEYGVPLARCRLAASPSEAVAAAAEMAVPVALKLAAPGVAHKTELDGIRLNLSAPAEIERAWREMEEVFRKRRPHESPAGFLVQEMVRGVETIVGTDNDPQFGPVVMFGIGGQAVEVYRDVVFRLAPVGPDEAAEMVRSIRGFRLLGGFRGRPAVDLNGLVRALVALSQLACAGRELIQSIDVNPLVCFEGGVKAVDAVIVTRQAGSGNSA
ncbi:MAG TPA: acetate--CoA ligase family protein [candidate division Zixibacteria bacterium]|nr:acetate--CoA ligase family protein [candidate division Zixibacteria bacterium]